MKSALIICPVGQKISRKWLFVAVVSLFAFQFSFSQGRVNPGNSPSADQCAGLKSETFDAVFYADKYPDLKEAFGYNCEQLYNHWLTYGIKEGRQSAPGFDVRSYLFRYKDLVNAFGSTNYPSALDHWNTFGKWEGRNPGPAKPAAGPCSDYQSETFDAIFYANKYPDLKAAFGYDCTKLFDHWMVYGINEGRQSTAKFSISSYLGRYADLVQAFGANGYKAALKHWVEFGKAENRNAKP